MKIPVWMTMVADDSLVDIKDMCRIFNVNKVELKQKIKRGLIPNSTVHLRSPICKRKINRYWVCKDIKDFINGVLKPTSPFESVPMYARLPRELRVQLDNQNMLVYSWETVKKLLLIPSDKLELMVNGGVLLPPDYYLIKNGKTNKEYFWIEPTYFKMAKHYRDLYDSVRDKKLPTKEVAVKEKPQLEISTVDIDDGPQLELSTVDIDDDFMDTVREIKRLTKTSDVNVRITVTLG